MLAMRAPAMGADQLDFAAIRVHPPGHATFLVAERPWQSGHFSSTGSALSCMAFCTSKPLQLQGGLAHVLFDEAQALFGMLLDLLQALAEVFPPAGDVLFEQAVLTVGDDFIDQRFQRRGGESDSAADKQA